MWTQFKRAIGQVGGLTLAIRYQIRPTIAVKGQAIVDFLPAHPIPDDSPLGIDLPNEES